MGWVKVSGATWIWVIALVAGVVLVRGWFRASVSAVVQQSDKHSVFPDSPDMSEMSNFSNTVGGSGISGNGFEFSDQ